MDFMGVIEAAFQGVFYLFAKDMEMPPPIGTIAMGDIFLFFACGYILADTVGSVSERRD